MIRRWRLRRAEVDAGFTLIELLVSMIMLAIVGLIVATAASTALRTNAQSEVTVSKSQDASVAMDRMTRQIRAAYNPIYTPATSANAEVDTPGIVASGPFAITYYTNLKNIATTCPNTGSLPVPEQVTDQVVADPNHPGTNMLTETVTPGSCTGSVSPVYTWPAAASTTSTLAYGVATSATTPSSLCGSVTGASLPPLFSYCRPKYFDQGTASDATQGAANCAATTAVAAVPATTGPTTTEWVGAQPGISVAGSVASVIVSLTLTGNGTNAPQFATSSKNVTTATTVTIDAANNFLSRDGTCS